MRLWHVGYQDVLVRDQPPDAIDVEAQPAEGQESLGQRGETLRDFSRARRPGVFEWFRRLDLQALQPARREDRIPVQRLDFDRSEVFGNGFRSAPMRTTKPVVPARHVHRRRGELVVLG